MLNRLSSRRGCGTAGQIPECVDRPTRGQGREELGMPNLTGPRIRWTAGGLPPDVDVESEGRTRWPSSAAPEALRARPATVTPDAATESSGARFNNRVEVVAVTVRHKDRIMTRDLLLMLTGRRDERCGRLQWPSDKSSLGQHLNKLFTMHARRDLLVVMPMAAALAIPPAPADRCRDVAFPPEASVWAFFFGGVVLNLSWVWVEQGTAAVPMRPTPEFRSRTPRHGFWVRPINHG